MVNINNKKLKSSFILFVLFISLIFPISATNNYNSNNINSNDLPSNNLDFWSKLKKSFKTFTIEGQNAGCSVYPDSVRKSVKFSSYTYRDVKDLSFNTGSLSNNGKIDIYAVNSDGTWKFLKELNYGQKFSFIGNKKYAIEYYNCPEIKQKVVKVSDCKTPDNFKQGDIICKAGSYLAEVNFDISDNTCKVKYNKVASCSNGCDFSYCNQVSINNKEIVNTNDKNGNIVEVWSDQESSKEYEKVVQQLNNKIVELDKLNKQLEEQRKVKEQKQVNGQISALEQEKQNIQNQDTSISILNIVIVIILIGGLIYLLI